jgi:hypothetical protein
LQSNAEDSDSSGTLPREELNPLLNPLLSQNMGRWAEVYFKAAPEDREQAVQGLLHELQAGSPPESSSSPLSSSSLSASRTTGPDGFEAREEEDRAVGRADDDADDREYDHASVIRCPQCHHENPHDYNFCGACRAPLAADGAGVGEASAHEQQEASFLLDPIVDPELESDRDAKQSSLPGHLWQKDLDPQQIQEQRSRRRKWNFVEPGRVATPANRDDAQDQVPDRTGHYFDLHRNRSSSRDADLFQLPSLVEPRRSYRLYIGAVVALLIAFLAYRAWRAEQSTLFSTHTAPQVPAVASDNSNSSAAAGKADLPQSNQAQPSAPLPDASLQPNTTPQPKAAPPNTGSATRPNAISAAATSSAATNSGVEEAAEKTPAPAGNTQAAPQAEADTVGGWSELATAKNYLNGTGGKEQNSAQAAAWLWKAVSKQNAEASTLLAELYMKGEGVSKNCDQGRVLLDAAVRKGRKDAAERLSHLGAFGCQ